MTPSPWLLEHEGDGRCESFVIEIVEEIWKCEKITLKRSWANSRGRRLEEAKIEETYPKETHKSVWRNLYKVSLTFIIDVTRRDGTLFIGAKENKDSLQRRGKFKKKIQILRPKESMPLV